MQVELRKTSSLKPYHQNPRSSQTSVHAVVESIRRFGFRQPIVVDPTGVIVCGHTRWRAAKRLQLATVPVHVVAELSETDLRAYRLADNKAAEMSAWIPELLVSEVAAIGGEAIDWERLGFGDLDLGSILGSPERGIDDDHIPLAPEKSHTKVGDLIALGRHRLLCGDSASRPDVDRLIKGATDIRLVYTDPPYNAAVKPRTAAGGWQRHHAIPMTARIGVRGDRPNAARQRRARDRPLLNDDLSHADYAKMLDLWIAHVAHALAPGGVFYLWGGAANSAAYQATLAGSKLHLSQCIVWHKLHPVLGRTDFMSDHEWCFYGWKRGRAHRFFGASNIPDVWQAKKVPPAKMLHLTEKPVELAERAIECSSLPGEKVLDLFAGSGSTLIAAEKTGRTALLMELDPLYCDVILRRWEEFTGRRARRYTRGKRCAA